MKRERKGKEIGDLVSTSFSDHKRQMDEMAPIRYTE